MDIHLGWLYYMAVSLAWNVEREGMKGYYQYYDAEIEHEYLLLQTTMSLGFSLLLIF